MAKPLISPYSAIAEEYYDSALHKTSRNFDAAGKAQLLRWRGRVRSKQPILEVGAGRGRCKEFFGIDTSTVVQLDSSAEMLRLTPREASALRVHHSAEELPFLEHSFLTVAAFLCDPFLGLNFLSEAYRVLAPGGVLIGTTPNKCWGERLRQKRGLDERSTLFINRQGGTVLVPSILVSPDSLQEMLVRSGFDGVGVEIRELSLPEGTEPISDDIASVAQEVGIAPHQLPILIAFCARKGRM